MLLTVQEDITSEASHTVVFCERSARVYSGHTHTRTHIPPILFNNISLISLQCNWNSIKTHSAIIKLSHLAAGVCCANTSLLRVINPLHFNLSLVAHTVKVEFDLLVRGGSFATNMRFLESWILV